VIDSAAGSAPTPWLGRIAAELAPDEDRVTNEVSDAGRPGYGTRVGLSLHLWQTFTVTGKQFGIRGVTYGTFLPRADGQPFLPTSDVHRDFAAIRERGLNAVRTYHVPPLDVLGAAEAAGLRLLVGLEYRDWRLLEPGRRSRGPFATPGAEPSMRRSKPAATTEEQSLVSRSAMRSRPR
jgi:hypothetical protein